MSKLIQAATVSKPHLQTLPALPCLVLKYLFRPWGEPQHAQSPGWELTGQHCDPERWGGLHFKGSSDILQA